MRHLCGGYEFPNGGGHPTLLILAQPNFHYPIPASFELTQRVPTDWVCVGPRIRKALQFQLPILYPRQLPLDEMMPAVYHLATVFLSHHRRLPEMFLPRDRKGPGI